MKFSTWLSETESSTFTMYHGGGRWDSRPEIRPSRKGRYEGGVGIYLCSSWQTAKKYAKGGKVITICEVDSNYRDASKVQVNLSTAIEFLRSIRIKNRNKIIDDLISFCERTQMDSFSADILNNLIVNYESGSGNAGIEVLNFLVSMGVDASHQRQSMEHWLVVFNPSIIKSYRTVSSKEQVIFDLPGSKKWNAI